MVAKQDERASVKPVTPMRRSTQHQAKFQLVSHRVNMAVKVVQLIGAHSAADIAGTFFWRWSQLIQNRAAHRTPFVTQI